MTVDVQFFSRLRDIAGESRIRVELPEEGASLQDLLAILYSRHPGLKAWDAHLLLAVGLEFAERGQKVRAGDVVSIMPPVQGG